MRIKYSAECFAAYNIFNCTFRDNLAYKIDLKSLKPTKDGKAPHYELKLNGRRFLYPALWGANEVVASFCVLFQDLLVGFNHLFDICVHFCSPLDFSQTNW